MDAPTDGDLMRVLGHATAESELRGRVVNGLEAQDVVHEIFAELLLTAKAETFDPSRLLRPWLMTVVRNKARDLLRGEQRHADLTDRTHPRSAGATDQQSAAHLAVEELFSRLTPEERRLCERFYLEDVPAADIARDLDIDTVRVYRELHRIRTRLRTARPSC
jgi:RNA polymerase sigma factor (sigma-70 family)